MGMAVDPAGQHELAAHVDFPGARRQVAPDRCDGFAFDRHICWKNSGRARNDATVGFAGIQNVSNGGIFLDGFQPLFLAGANGIVGTQGQSGILDRQILPGPDGVLGTADDEIIPLNNFQRQITIQPLIDSTGNVSPDIRQISITVQVTSPGRGIRNYTVTGYISRFQ